MLRLLSIGVAIAAVLALYQPQAHPTTRTRLIMLGTGTPEASPERFGPATVVLVDDTPYLVDAGVGVVRRWSAAIAQHQLSGLHPSDLKTAFITHLHSDHTLGYPDLILTSWTLEDDQRRRPLNVFGPSGLREMTTHLLAAYRADIEVRRGKGGELEGDPPPAVNVHEIKPGIVHRDAHVTITAFAVHHGTWPEAYGYRFQTPDMDIVISGDAASPSTIPAQCHRCDILVHEGGRPQGAVRPGGYYHRFHTTAEELAEIAKQSQPKLLVLYHQATSDSQRALRTVQAHYSGSVVVAKDLDVFP